MSTQSVPTLKLQASISGTLPPNSAVIAYVIEGALISVHLSVHGIHSSNSHDVSALRKFEKYLRTN